MIRTLAADIRHALRVLSRTPAFSGAVIFVLAVGIGANAAIFSIVNAVLLRPLPFKDPNRLVRLFHEPPQSTFPGIHRFAISPANFYDWQRRTHSFDGMALYGGGSFVLTGSGAARSVTAGVVGPDLFQIVGVEPSLGRLFLPEEDSPGKTHVVILSDAFWRRELGSAPDAVGRVITLNGESYTVVGIMPARFTVPAWFLGGRDIWLPLGLTPKQRAVRDNHNYQAVARLRDGVTLAQAQAEMTAVSAQLAHEYPREDAGWGAVVMPLKELIVGDIRMPLAVVFAAVGLVLLIACANVGNLLLARALGRRKELAIRTALGAGRWRVFQQLLVESLVLAFAGGALGVLLANVTLEAAARVLADQVPRANEISIDTRVLFFAMTVSAVAGVLAGALPAIRTRGSELNEALKEGGRNDSAVGMRTRRVLIAAEVAISVVLLMGAGLMVRTLFALRQVDAGFDPAGTLTMHVNLPRTKYVDPAATSAFFQAALQRVRALPGVQSAGGVDDLPLTGGSVQPIVLEGHAELGTRDQPTVEVRHATPGYLAAMRIPIFRGRDITSSDVNVLLVSRATAQLLWGDTDPIGRRVTLPLEKSPVLEVIGITGDVKQQDLSQPSSPTVYEYSHDRGPQGLNLVLRAAIPPTSLAQAAVSAIRSLDPDQPVDNVRTMQSVVDETLVLQRFSAQLLAAFALAALLLAGVGIYSVLSYIVRSRSREIGIRTALGASSTDVVRLVVREGMTPALAGIVVGAAVALVAGRVMQRLVFGVSTSDPLTLALVALALGSLALVASLVPGYRASRVDPLVVLRGN